MSELSPPFLPVFGTGAPGGTVPHTATYFDTSTAPFTPYIYEAGAWHTFGAGTGSTNATAIQGIPVDATTPLDGQTLVYNSGANKYIPADVAGTPTPTIVQHAISASNTVVFGAAPTKGNLLVCVASHFSNAIVPFNPTAGKGWANYSQTDGSSTDGFLFFYKVAGAGESTSQQPLNSSPTGVTAVWEITGAAGGIIDTTVGQHDLNATPTVTQNITTAGNNELVLALFATATNNLNLPTGIAGFTQDDTVAASQRAGVSGHLAAAVAGVHALSATWAANPTAVVTAAVAII